MRIHTDDITLDDVRRAVALIPGMTYVATEHRSRSRARRIDLTLVDDGTMIVKGRRQAAATAANGAKGASFDEWGIVISALFDADPRAVIGPYQGRDDFLWTTNWRYTNLAWEDACHVHRWDYVPVQERECRKCGAVVRTPGNGFAAAV